MEKQIKTIGVLTSGGDAPGMNAAVRAVVRTGLHKGFRMIGIQRGYNGLLNGECFEMNLRSVSNIISAGGTILYTARCLEFKTKEGQDKGAAKCRELGIDALVVIGGDGSYRGARELAHRGIPMIGLPGTIDNDIACTDYTIGYDTAMNTALEMIDKLRDTTQSHDRCSVVEVMGRNAGYIALNVAIASGAMAVLLPEKEFDMQRDILDKIVETQRTGKRHFIVIVAEGTNTLLSERCLGNARPAPCQMAVGIKEVFELPAGVIEDRFLLPEGEGAAMLFVGDCTHGKVGGGFLYTNRDSISLGLVATISTAAGGGNDTPVYQMLEDFKGHPAVAPIIRGAKMVEHSGHMVPEGGYDMVPQYVFDGALLAGEAAGLCMNMGYQVRGMDFAVASGRMAAEAAVEAIDAGDASAAGLSGYARRMEDSFVIKDLKTFRKWPHVMEEWDAMFNDYPTMAAEVFNAMFSVDGRPQEPLRRRIMPIIKKRGLFKTANEVRKAVSAL